MISRRRQKKADNGKIVLYADPAFQSSAGIEQYTWELLKGISTSDLRERSAFLCTREDWAASLADRLSPLYLDSPPPVVLRKLPTRVLRYFWTFTGQPSVETLIGQDLALVHNPASLRFPARRCPQVVTVHDVFPAKMPSLLTRRQRLVLTRQLGAQSIRRATHIIADSYNTKRDICDLYKKPARQITVVPLGIDHKIFKPVTNTEHIQRTLSKYQIDKPFVLYVGSLYSRKIGKLLEAFSRACALSGQDYKLVVVGGRELYTQRETDLRTRIKALDLESRVVITGVVPQEDVSTLMSAAQLFVYVSYYEGFGLSPLEAMACGAPVVVSETSSLPEVVGDAGCLVDPSNEEEIATAMAQLMTNEHLREQLRGRSIARGQQFSWQKTVDQTLGVYKRLMGDNATA